MGDTMLTHTWNPCLTTLQNHIVSESLLSFLHKPRVNCGSIPGTLWSTNIAMEYHHFQ